MLPNCFLNLSLPSGVMSDSHPLQPVKNRQARVAAQIIAEIGRLEVKRVICIASIRWLVGNLSVNVLKTERVR